ncbi:AEC family transporter [Halovulum dunhuangense]|uniref:AEC family transporter n=1 Tax=Halovulum dunhuangense TaxID=1505036 RepID=A0A849L2C2_9RHOB|nr:AEC family transporter [Halovulum dunhuangense]NNU80390.1 AEC family transporter [Halovulum dunhuangense]
MSALLQVVIPVFLVTAAGYAAVRLRYFTDAHIDGMNRYAIAFAVPALLFRAAMELDLAAVFDPRLLLSFYAGNTTAFLMGLLGARLIFRRRPGEAVAIAFGALFSNSVILGVPIVDRAFGPEALAASFAIITIHAPFCYLLGITVMEISRADGRSAADTAKAVANAMLRNALMIGLALGFAVNLTGLALPDTVLDALGLVVASALPVALFALGGVLTRYRLSATLGEAAMVTTLSLILHPAITLFLTHVVFDLPRVFVQGAVLTAAMAPGVNAYVFASMYKRAEDVAASAVLLGTVTSVLSISVWLLVLGGI